MIIVVKEHGEIMNISGNTRQILENLRPISQFICHRMPNRTFKIKGHYFPVCSRCTGFYIGAFSYFLFVYYFYVDYTVALIIFAVLMLIPAFIDGITQFFRFRESNNVLRFFTGLLGGVGLAILIKALKWIIFVNLIS